MRSDRRSRAFPLDRRDKPMSSSVVTEHTTARGARVLLAAATDTHVADVCSLLEQMGHRPRWVPIEGAFRDADSVDGWDLVVLDGGDDDRVALNACARAHAALDGAFVPIVYVTRRSDTAVKLRSLELGADAHLCRPLEQIDLVTRVRSLLRIKALQDRLSSQNNEMSRMHQELKLAYQKLDQELRLAHRLQKSFLPQSLPDIGPVRFAVRYHMCGRVGGDFYDVFRLDEHHVGFYVADAVGHGVPAALLTVFVKKGIRTKHIEGNAYRIVSPGEALTILNQDLLAHELDDSPFISMFYGMVNTETLQVQYARAGHPYPLCLPRDGVMHTLDADGGLLGVTETEFCDATVQLQPGDKLLVYTDGIDPVAWKDHPTGTESFVQCVLDHRDRGVTEMVDHVCESLFATDAQGELDLADDLTLMGVGVLPQ